MLADALVGRGAQVMRILGPGRVMASTSRRRSRHGVGSSTGSYSTVKPLRLTGSGGPAIRSVEFTVVEPL